MFVSCLYNCICRSCSICTVLYLDCLPVDDIRQILRCSLLTWCRCPTSIPTKPRPRASFHCTFCLPSIRFCPKPRPHVGRVTPSVFLLSVLSGCNPNPTLSHVLQARRSVATVSSAARRSTSSSWRASPVSTMPAAGTSATVRVYRLLN